MRELMPKKIAVDLQYETSRTFWSDLQLLLRNGFIDSRQELSRGPGLSCCPVRGKYVRKRESKATLKRGRLHLRVPTPSPKKSLCEFLEVVVNPFLDKK